MWRRTAWVASICMISFIANFEYPLFGRHVPYGLQVDTIRAFVNFVTRDINEATLNNQNSVEIDQPVPILLARNIITLLIFSRESHGIDDWPVRDGLLSSAGVIWTSSEAGPIALLPIIWQRKQFRCSRYYIDIQCRFPASIGVFDIKMENLPVFEIGPGCLSGSNWSNPSALTFFNRVSRIQYQNPGHDYQGPGSDREPVISFTALEKALYAGIGVASALAASLVALLGAVFLRARLGGAAIVPTAILWSACGWCVAHMIR